MSLSDSIRDVVNERLRTVWTSSIGRIDRVYNSELRCDVTLLYQSDGIDISLKKVPVMIQRAGKSAILLPYKEGDLVVIVFNRSPNSVTLFDGVKADNALINFSNSNAMIVCSISSFPERGSVLYEDENLVIPTDGIHIVSDEKVIIKSPETRVLGLFIESSTLPTASVAYRGKFVLVAGGVGTRDTLYMCMKSDSDTYSWVSIADGGA